MLTKEMLDENFLLHGSDAASLGDRSLTFRAKILPLSALEEPGREVRWSSPCIAGRRLRKSGAVTPLPYTHLRCAQGQIFTVK